jgi:adenylate kinase
MEKGALVPDDVAVRMIKGRLAEPDAAEGAILDGFPRTVPQAEALDRMLAAQGSRVRGALYVEVDRDELARRLSGRRVCTGPDQHVFHIYWKPPTIPGICDLDGSPLEQRADDRPATVHARLETQLPPMFEVVDHYAERGTLYPVRGDRTIKEVTEALLHAVDTACAAL